MHPPALPVLHLTGRMAGCAIVAGTKESDNSRKVPDFKGFSACMLFHVIVSNLSTRFHFSATPQHTLFAYFPGKPFQQGQSETGGRIPASACLAFCISVFRLWPGAPERHPSPILLDVSQDTPVQTPRKPKRRTRSRSAGSRYSGCVLAPQLLSPPTPICCSATRTTVWCTGGNSYAWAAFSSSCRV